MKDTVSSITFKMAMSQSMRNLAKISPALQWLLLCKDTESHHRDKISLSILSCSELQKTNRSTHKFTRTQVSVERSTRKGI